MKAKIRIAELAGQRGFKNAYALQNALKCSPTMASRLWSGEFKQIGIETMDKLCDLFKCSYNDLFGYDVASASVPELSKPQSAPVSNAKDVHRRLKKLSGGNVKKSDGSLVVSDNVASDNEGLLKTSIVAERLGVSERTVRDYYDGKSGGVKLVSVKVGTKRFVRESDLNDFIARRGKK